MQPDTVEAEFEISVSSLRTQGPIPSEQAKATSVHRLTGDTAYGSLRSQGRLNNSDWEHTDLTDERRILVWMCVLVAVNQLGFGAMVPSLPLYASSFGVSASAVGLTVAIYGFARFLVIMPGG